ncbi:Meckelin, partial [Habropoda laboriosa]
KRSNFLKTYSSSVINGEHIFNTQLKLKQLLCKFVDHCIKHEDYIIKEQHFFEKLFNIIFSSNEEKSIFYIDNNYTFNQVLLYGNEWLLATFEISIFTFIIVLCEDCILAITLTALTSMFLSIIVKYNCKKNLSNNIVCLSNND